MNQDIVDIERIDDEMVCVHYSTVITDGKVRFEIDQSYDFTTMNTPNDCKPVWAKLVQGHGQLNPALISAIMQDPGARSLTFDGITISSEHMPMQMVLTHLALCSIQSGRWWGWLNG